MRRSSELLITVMKDAWQQGYVVLLFTVYLFSFLQVSPLKR